MVLLVAPLVFRAPEGPAAREARASLRSAPRLEARPCPPVPPAPSTPVGPGCFVCLWASSGSRVLSFWGARVRVVTNVVNPRCFLCGFLPRCYERRQSEGFFAENGGFWAWIDDVCNRGSHEVI